MGESNRSNIAVSQYDFRVIKEFGKDPASIKLNESGLFLELSIKDPDINRDYKFWESFCKNFRHPYIIAEGTLKPESYEKLVHIAAKQFNKTPEEIIDNDYSLDAPKRVFGFFRSEEDF